VSQKEQYAKRKRQYQVEIQKKYAIPFACLLFVFVGCPLGIITKGGNFGFSAAISLAFYIFYWACLIGGEKLADRGMLSPQLSMWLGNAIIALFGLLLTLRVNNESFRFFKK
jgi:lipopolysaccharide export system permease protein